MLGNLFASDSFRLIFVAHIFNALPNMLFVVFHKLFFAFTSSMFFLIFFLVHSCCHQCASRLSLVFVGKMGKTFNFLQFWPSHSLFLWFLPLLLESPYTRLAALSPLQPISLNPSISSFICVLVAGFVIPDIMSKWFYSSNISPNAVDCTCPASLQPHLIHHGAIKYWLSWIQVLSLSQFALQCIVRYYFLISSTLVSGSYNLWYIYIHHATYSIFLLFILQPHYYNHFFPFTRLCLSLILPLFFAWLSAPFLRLYGFFVLDYSYYISFHSFLCSLYYTPIQIMWVFVYWPANDLLYPLPNHISVVKSFTMRFLLFCRFQFLSFPYLRPKQIEIR